MPAPKRVEYINGGVKLDDDTTIMTRKELSRLLAEDAPVQFYTTSMFGPMFDGPIKEALRRWPNNVLQVTGPDPRKSRMWYASIKLNSKGEIRVS